MVQPAPGPRLPGAVRGRDPDPRPPVQVRRGHPGWPPGSRIGPYRLLRHPSYTGGLVAFLGAGIALDSWLSVLALVFVPLLAVLVRIHVEEAELVTALGPEYTRYASRTHRLVPGLW